MPLRKYHGGERFKMLKKNGKNLEWQDEVGS